MKRTYEGLRPSLMVADIDLIKKILVEEFHKFPNHRIFYNESQLAGKSLVVLENESWKRVRNIITPIFTTLHLKNMKKYIDECVLSLENNLAIVAESGKAIDVKDYFSAFAIDVVCSSVFGVKIDSVNNPNHSLVKNLRRFFGRNISFKSLLVFWWPSLMKTFDLYLFDYNILVYLNAFLMEVINRKRREAVINDTKSDDFIQLLMDARLEDDKCDESRRSNHSFFCCRYLTVFNK
ncbi:cytochrome P450 monooxygenase-like protein [Leptotrombidium deliense]|uniref:Cytochrome P450 monooxygenase-like protein n=1 Tax=Leptotrombidium deliense TaxID=299467 RepID=A0A443RWC7_9ACAR|nr:cytochrome P450 monooxygenase-like protein [Leptotrombidium deliense]